MRAAQIKGGRVWASPAAAAAPPLPTGEKRVQAHGETRGLQPISEEMQFDRSQSDAGVTGKADLRRSGLRGHRHAVAELPCGRLEPRHAG